MAKQKKPYEVLLDEVGESCKIILLLQKRGYHFDRPSMAAEKAYLYQMLDLLEKTVELKIQRDEIYSRLREFPIKLHSPCGEVVEAFLDKMWSYRT